MRSDSEVKDGNPIIRDTYTADPTAIVHDDTVFLYTGHDEAPVGTHEYVMNEWLCFSSTDLATWTEHPVPLRADDFTWSTGKAYASKVLAHDNRFHWFVSVGDPSGVGSAIAIATSTSPTGPFTDFLGQPLIAHDDLPIADNEKANLDPTVLIDGRTPYLWWGNGRCYFAELTPDLRRLASPIGTVDLPRFEEGAHIHAARGWYYLSYGYGTPERVAYAMSRSVHGPWEFRGILNEIPGNCETNRPCILEYRGQSFFLYHNGALPGGGSHRRSVCIDRLHYNPDGTMQRVVMTSEGPGGIS
jgi:hypothetical protein